MSESQPRRFWLIRWLSGAAALVVSACKLAPPIPGSAPSQPPGVVGPVPGNRGSARNSAAASPRAYREDGATHLYGLNAERIYKGRLPPLLYAVGVMNVEIDRTGRVTRLDWMR
ncbi:MAG: hypothetical protein JWP93_1538, partial [Polaromonas sp.]|nr:hypothetical protein [Polaromonas sp.]